MDFLKAGNILESFFNSKLLGFFDCPSLGLSMSQEIPVLFSVFLYIFFFGLISISPDVLCVHMKYPPLDTKKYTFLKQILQQTKIRSFLNGSVLLTKKESGLLSENKRKNCLSNQEQEEVPS